MQEKRISISQLCNQTDFIVREAKKDDVVLILTYYKEDFLVMIPIPEYNRLKSLDKKNADGSN